MGIPAVGVAALLHGLENLFDGSPHLPGEQTNPSPADTSAADSGFPGDTAGQPDWNKPVLDEQLGLPPSLAAQLGSGGLLSVLDLFGDGRDLTQYLRVDRALQKLPHAKGNCPVRPRKAPLSRSFGSFGTNAPRFSRLSVPKLPRNQLDSIRSLQVRSTSHR